MDYLGDLFEQYTGSADITFEELYDNFEVELVIPATNLTRSSGELCHVKLTPQMPIRVAVRASMSLPVLLEPVKWKRAGSEVDYPELYVDGGVVDNFPIRVFDGWWLSMSDDDSFERKIATAQGFEQRLSERFNGANQKTIGFRLTSEEEPDAAILVGHDPDHESHEDRLSIPVPDTRRGLVWKPKRERYLQHVHRQKEIHEAVDWLKDFAAKEYWRSNDPTHPPETHEEFIKRTQDIPEFKAVLKTLGMGSGGGGLAEILAEADLDGDGHITWLEAASYWQRHGDMRLVPAFGLPPKPVESVLGVVLRMVDTLQMHLERQELTPENLARTCVLDVEYVGVADFDLDPEDLRFLYASGKRQAIHWLRKRTKVISEEKKPATKIARLKKRLKEKEAEAQLLRILLKKLEQDAAQEADQEQEQKSSYFWS